MLTDDERNRYSRHLLLPQIGEEGQEKLKAASALIVGVGGLGSPAAMYLTAAGIGRLGLVDFDTVDESNLQRQILYGESVIGERKLDAAWKRLRDLNRNLRIETFNDRLSSRNALPLMEPYDIVLDGTDNFATRYLVNDACVMQGKPNVYASIYRFEGQVSVFDATRGPCYRCVYPDPPPPNLVPSCAEGGVLGVLPGIIGTLQAAEAIKLITGAGEPLIGRMLLFDALTATFRSLRIPKNANCKLCGPDPEIRELITRLRSTRTAAPATRGGQRATVDSLRQRLNTATDEINRLRTENTALRDQLARLLGTHRAQLTDPTR